MSDRPQGPSFDEAYEPDAEARREEENKAGLRLQEARKRSLARLLSNTEARAFLFELIEDCHAFETRFGVTQPQGHPHPEGTWLMAGEQKAGWWLWQQLDNAAPELASLMRREAKRLDDVLRETIE